MMLSAYTKHGWLTPWSLFILPVLLFTGTCHAQSFAHGAKSISVIVANGRAFDQDYTIIGVGGGYYVANGLELGLEVEAWTGGDPKIYKVTSSIRLVLNRNKQVKPYLGVFYRRVYIQGYPDLDSWGGRAGAIFATGPNSYAGVGIVYSRLRNCDQQIYQTCSESYPELSLGFTI